MVKLKFKCGTNGPAETANAKAKLKVGLGLCKAIGDLQHEKSRIKQNENQLKRSLRIGNSSNRVNDPEFAG